MFSSDFVLTHKGDNELCGIVTSSDMALWAKDCSQALLAVAEIERHRRGALRNVNLIFPDSIPAIAGTPDGALECDSWTFARYRRILDCDQAWTELPKEQLWSRIHRGE